MKEIIVFGRGKYFAEKSDEIKKNYKIAAFIDNAVTEEEADSAYGCLVYNPQKLNLLPRHDVLIVSSHFVEMWKQLKDLGVEDDRILFGNEIEPRQIGAESFAFGNGETLTSGGDSILYTTAFGGQYCFSSDAEFKDILRRTSEERYPFIQALASLPVKPVSRTFGSERGRAVDRYYIESFLAENALDIRGCCMEIGADTYIRRFGGDRVTETIVLHVEGYGNTLKGNFETGEGLWEEMADCLICTQTLQYIYDLRAAIKNIYKILKPGGVALITVPGIKSLCLFDEDSWGEKWSFTEKSMKNLCGELGEDVSFSVSTYGNVKIATAYLYGICCEELDEEDFAYSDRQFPFLITVRLEKRS